MATTTNYGWTTPDDTALVKDGAAAIRTLGSSVDTTTKNLNPETTLGDLAYRSSTANVKTRLGLGTAGQVLQVNSGANAPEWATPSSGGMTLISTTTLTGASVTLSSIPQTYNNLQFVVVNWKPVVDGDFLDLRFNADATANRHFAHANFTAQTAVAYNATFGRIARDQDSSTSQALVMGEIKNYANATTWKTCYVTALTNDYAIPTSLVGSFNSVYYNQTTAISSLQFISTTGNFTSGSLLLYGVK